MMHVGRTSTMVGVVFAGLVLAGSPKAQPALSTGTWTAKAPMSAPRAETSAIAAGGKLFALGGSVADHAIPRNEEYDPVTNRWRERAPMPVGRHHLGLALLDGKIYSFGGFSHSVGAPHQGAGPDAFRYDPATDSWLTLAPMKSERGSVGAAVLDGKIHVIGGRGLDGKTVTTHAVYDPVTGQWSEAAPLPRARDHMALVAAEGKIHAIGGRLGATVNKSDQHDVYDPATDSWSSAAPLKTARSGVAGVLYRGMILVLGGELAPNTHPENEGYDLKTKTWVSLAPMPAGRHGFGGGVIGANAYFAGGSLTPGSRGLTDQLIMFSMP